MDSEEEEESKQPIEYILIALACTIQLRQSKLELDELFFLRAEIDESIKNFRIDLHLKENQELNVQGAKM